MGALSVLDVGGVFCAPWFTKLGRPRRLLNEILPSIRRTAAPGSSRGGSASPSTFKGGPKDLTCVGGPLGLVEAIFRLNLRGARLDIVSVQNNPSFAMLELKATTKQTGLDRRLRLRCHLSLSYKPTVKPLLSDKMA